MAGNGKKDRDAVRRAAHQLARKTGWSTEDFQAKSPLEKLQELDAEAAGSQAYANAEACPECEKLRTQLNDDTALCEKHLAEAMGF